nr:outer membrane beta-barrel protein [uncultured Dyadobacter sp.]
MGYNGNLTAMKHFCVLFIAILPVFAYGQDAAFKGDFQFGAFGGRQLFGKIYDDRKMNAVSGWVAGVDVGYKSGLKKSGVSLHFQPNYSTFRDVLEEGENTQAYRRIEWKWAAVNLPLLLRYTFTNRKIRPFAEAGINLRLRTKLSMAYDLGICGVAGCTWAEGVDDGQKTVRHDPGGLIAAVGAEIDVLSVTIPVGIRLGESFGTYDLKATGTPSSGYGGLKTRVVQVTVGVNFQ